VPTTDDHDPFENLTLDEDFVNSAEHKEGSARARLLASRWKQQPPQDTAWRAPVVPLRRSRSRWQLPLGIAVAAGLVLVSMNAGRIHSALYGADRAATATPLAPETARPSSAAPTPDDPDTPTLAHPFAGSPAAQWASGSAGIYVPPAHGVGVYSSSDVASYLRKARQFLVLTNLDPAVLRGGNPQAALDLIDPLQKQLLAEVKRNLAHPSAKGSATDLVTRFNPDQAQLIGTTVKVRGELAFKGDGDGGLDITADVTFVYPLRPGPHPVPSAAPSTPVRQASDSTDVTRSIVRRIYTLNVPNPHKWQHTPGTFFIQAWNPDIGNTACGVDNGFVNPEFPEEAPLDPRTGESPTGPAVDPYDRSKVPDPKRAGCGTLSRT
jgi:hypothetical protein